MSAIAETPVRCRRRRPPCQAQCAGAGDRAGARGRQQHGDRRDRQHPRRDARAGQKPRDAADQHDGGRHVGRHLAARVSGEALRPPHRLRERRRLRRARGPDRLRGDRCRRSFWLYLVATFCGGLYAASHMSYRFGAADTASAGVQAEGDRLGDGGRAVRRDPRAAARDLHQGPDAAVSVRRELSRAGRVRASSPASSS